MDLAGRFTCQGFRTLELFSALDKQVVEKGEKTSITSAMYQNAGLGEHVRTRILPRYASV